MEPQSTKLHVNALTAVPPTSNPASAPPQEKGAIGIAFLVWLLGGGLGLAVLVFILLKAC